MQHRQGVRYVLFIRTWGQEYEETPIMHARLQSMNIIDGLGSFLTTLSQIKPSTFRPSFVWSASITLWIISSNTALSLSLSLSLSHTHILLQQPPPLIYPLLSDLPPHQTLDCFKHIWSFSCFYQLSSMNIGNKQNRIPGSCLCVCAYVHIHPIPKVNNHLLVVHVTKWCRKNDLLIPKSKMHKHHKLCTW